MDLNQLPRNTVPVNISMPFNFLFEVDKVVGELGQTRSRFIIDALKEKMERIKREKE